MVQSVLAVVGTAAGDVMVLGCFGLVDWEEMVRLVALGDITKTRNLAGRYIL